MYKDYDNKFEKLSLKKLVRVKSNGYSTRNNHVLDLERFKTVKFGYNGLKFTGAKFFNSIPLEYKGKYLTMVNFIEIINRWNCFNGLNCDKCHENVLHGPKIDTYKKV